MHAVDSLMSEIQLPRKNYSKEARLLKEVMMVWVIAHTSAAKGKEVKTKKKGCQPEDCDESTFCGLDRVQ